MTIWKKPNGTEVELNDEKATVDFATAQGWIKKGVKKKEAAPETEKPVSKSVAVSKKKTRKKTRG